MRLDTQLSLKHEMSEAWNKPDSLQQCINVARNFSQIVKSECKEVIEIQSECIQQLSKLVDPKSPLGMQVKLVLERAKSL